jgi:hypothetical protein
MLRRISEPLALSEASLLALRPAMNAPVLNVDFLPVGPARAAIVVFAEEYGGIGMAFGMRSTEGGQVAVFKNREPIDDSTSIQDLLEPALASAERMGFLFDDDMLEDSPGGQGRSEATALWGRLMGDVAMPPPPKAAPPLPAATEPILDLTEALDPPIEAPELVLDEVARTRPPPVIAPDALVPVIEEDQIETERELRPVAAPPVVAPTPKLSKFRQPDPAATGRVANADAGDTTQSDSPSHIGRVPLVRVRRAGDGMKRIPYIARLLSSF